MARVTLAPFNKIMAKCIGLLFISVFIAGLVVLMTVWLPHNRYNEDAEPTTCDYTHQISKIWCQTSDGTSYECYKAYVVLSAQGQSCGIGNDVGTAATAPTTEREIRPAKTCRPRVHRGRPHPTQPTTTLSPFGCARLCSGPLETQSSVPSWPTHCSTIVACTVTQAACSGPPTPSAPI